MGSCVAWPLRSAEDGVHGVDNFGAATIIQGDIENHPGISSGGFGGFTRVALHRLGKFVGAAEEAHADVVALEERQFLAQIFAQKLHQEFDFGFGAAPIFNGEGIEGEGLDLEARAGFDGSAGRLRARAVTGDARKMTLLGPAAIPVHDDGDVAGEASQIELFKEYRLFGTHWAEFLDQRRESRELESRLGQSQPIQ